MNESLSIQDRLYPESTCFGCGPANPQGLQIKSFEVADAVISTFQPQAMHTNGANSVNGGIIATILDCHSGSAVILESSRGLGPDEPRELWVTAGFELKYRRPTPLDQPCLLHAHITEITDSSMIVTTTLTSEDKVRVEAQLRWAKVRPR